ncbi:hypothetical protein GJ496_010212 [Pomphorhynchus laevis]|nr:hypothetical protein GJ496_010212 [Pomphorhynchus laevis]
MATEAASSRNVLSKISYDTNEVDFDESFNSTIICSANHQDKESLPSTCSSTSTFCCHCSNSDDSGDNDSRINVVDPKNDSCGNRGHACGREAEYNQNSRLNFQDRMRSIDVTPPQHQQRSLQLGNISITHLNEKSNDGMRSGSLIGLIDATMEEDDDESTLKAPSNKCCRISSSNINTDMTNVISDMTLRTSKNNRYTKLNYWSKKSLVQTCTNENEDHEGIDHLKEPPNQQCGDDLECVSTAMISSNSRPTKTKATPQSSNNLRFMNYTKMAKRRYSERKMLSDIGNETYGGAMNLLLNVAVEQHRYSTKTKSKFRLKSVDNFCTDEHIYYPLSTLLLTLYEHGSHTTGIFRKCPNYKHVDELIDRLNIHWNDIKTTNSKYNKIVSQNTKQQELASNCLHNDGDIIDFLGEPHLAAAILKRILQSDDCPFFPISVCTQWIEACGHQLSHCNDIDRKSRNNRSNRFNNRARKILLHMHRNSLNNTELTSCSAEIISDIWSKRISSSAQMHAVARKAINDLSKPKQLLIKFLMCLLYKIQSNKIETNMDCDGLAICTSSVLFQNCNLKNLSNACIFSQSASSFTSFLLRNCTCIFGSEVIDCIKKERYRLKVNYSPVEKVVDKNISSLASRCHYQERVRPITDSSSPKSRQLTDLKLLNREYDFCANNSVDNDNKITESTAAVTSYNSESSSSSQSPRRATLAALLSQQWWSSIFSHHHRSPRAERFKSVGDNTGPLLQPRSSSLSSITGSLETEKRNFDNGLKNIGKISTFKLASRGSWSYEQLTSQRSHDNNNDCCPDDKSYHGDDHEGDNHVDDSYTNYNRRDCDNGGHIGNRENTTEYNDKIIATNSTNKLSPLINRKGIMSWIKNVYNRSHNINSSRGSGNNISRCDGGENNSVVDATRKCSTETNSSINNNKSTSTLIVDTLETIKPLSKRSIDESSKERAIIDNSQLTKQSAYVVQNMLFSEMNDQQEHQYHHQRPSPLSHHGQKLRGIFQKNSITSNNNRILRYKKNSKMGEQDNAARVDEHNSLAVQTRSVDDSSTSDIQSKKLAIYENSSILLDSVCNTDKINYSKNSIINAVEVRSGNCTACGCSIYRQQSPYKVNINKHCTTIVDRTSSCLLNSLRRNQIFFENEYQQNYHYYNRRQMPLTDKPFPLPKEETNKIKRRFSTPNKVCLSNAAKSHQQQPIIMTTVIPPVVYRHLLRSTMHNEPTNRNHHHHYYYPIRPNAANINVAGKVKSCCFNEEDYIFNRDNASLSKQYHDFDTMHLASIAGLTMKAASNRPPLAKESSMIMNHDKLYSRTTTGNSYIPRLVSIRAFTKKATTDTTGKSDSAACQNKSTMFHTSIAI